MFLRFLIPALMLVAVGGCATYRDVNHEKLSSFSQHYEQFDLKMAWNVKAEGDKTILDGVITNVRYNRIYDLELRVAALDNEGKTAAHSIFTMNELKRDDTVPFSTIVAMPATPGTKLRFTYRYKSSDGGGMSGEDWMQSFETIIPAGQ
jgi:hypothetical protein